MPTRNPPVIGARRDINAARYDCFGLVPIARDLIEQDEVGTFPNSVAMGIIEQDLGLPANQIFDFVHPNPVASASIGQVSATCAPTEETHEHANKL